ncbi:SMI1/KNR4 family protein [Kordia sp.]|uniref:SMI1/KNR4 family protein n=1 Tax=Kordia sp. TaxID=1965332 RepID=UPI003B58FC9D
MDITSIKNKIRKLYEVNPDGEYRANEALTEEEVVNFEKKHAIKLPQAYKALITELYNGGFGPSDGIFPLYMWNSTMLPVEGHDTINTDLSKPFLLTKETEIDYDNPAHDEITNGTIRIAHIGCGNFLFLVVNGEEYGNIWIDDRASNDEIVPLQQYGKERITFEEWYMDWLNELIRQHEEVIELYHFKIDEENEIVINANFNRESSLLIDTITTDLYGEKYRKQYRKRDISTFSMITVEKNQLPKLFLYYGTEDRIELLQKIKNEYNDENLMLNFQSFLKRENIEFDFYIS